MAKAFDAATAPRISKLQRIIITDVCIGVRCIKNRCTMKRIEFDYREHKLMSIALKSVKFSCPQTIAHEIRKHHRNLHELKRGF